MRMLTPDPSAHADGTDSTDAPSRCLFSGLLLVSTRLCYTAPARLGQAFGPVNASQTEVSNAASVEQDF
jgi:hypothetical protein